MSASLAHQVRWEASYLAFAYQQLFCCPPPVHADLTGQIAIITGANRGLGYEAARRFLQLGLSRLILAVRSQTKGDTAAALLRTAFPDAVVEVWILDMVSQRSVQLFAARCDQELERLDVVVLNAGLQNLELTTFADGQRYETTYQVNYLSTVLLAVLLLPVLRKKRGSALGARRQPARLVVVGSSISYWAEFVPLAGPVLPRVAVPEVPYRGCNQYAITKMLLAGFVPQLAEMVKPDEVIVSLVSPGLVVEQNESWISHCPWPGRVMLRALGRSLEWGANTYVDAVVNKGVESHGSFVSNWAIKPYPAVYYTAEGKEMMNRLWEETMEELRLTGAILVIAELACVKS